MLVVVLVVTRVFRSPQQQRLATSQFDVQGLAAQEVILNARGRACVREYHIIWSRHYLTISSVVLCDPIHSR